MQSLGEGGEEAGANTDPPVFITRISQLLIQGGLGYRRTAVITTEYHYCTGHSPLMIFFVFPGSR